MIFHEEFICLDRKMDFYLHVNFFVFATVLLPQYSLNVNIKWGKGGGGCFKCEKLVIVPRVLAKIVVPVFSRVCISPKDGTIIHMQSCCGLLNV